YYRDLGEGPAVVIVHGLLGSSDNWGTLGKQLADAFRVVMVDMRNHGRSPHHPQFSYADMVGDLHELVQDLGIKKMHLVGHSMGGKASMTYARYYPHKLLSLTVADIAPRSYRDNYYRELLGGLLALDTAQIRSREEADRALVDLVPEKGMRAFIVKNLRRDHQGGYHWKMNVPVLLENLDGITGPMPEGHIFEGPTLFIRGGRSPYIKEKDRVGIHERFPQAHVETIPDAGHWVHADAPEAFLEILRDFLSRNA
ncbi:MAG TPA: alpha/beta fold hydrolase, partial [Calditrichia bacterium]|nr:alpha/beta fold hydrolase [Calditrichia bacterium]